MPDDAIGLETPEVETPETEVETASTEVETPDTGVETPEGEPETEPKGTPAIANGKLSEAARNTLKEIGAKDPVLAKSLKTALYEQEALRRIMPDGIKGVQALRQQLEQIGAPEEVARAREELSEWSDLDNAYTSGDPRFIERITNSPEGKAAFLQLAPVVFDKFMEMNPDGYSAYVAKTFVADMVSNEFPIAMKLLQYQIKDNPAAMEEWNKLAAYYDRLSTFAKKPVSAPKVEKPTEDREAQLAERETQLVRKEWTTQAVNQRRGIYDAEFKRLSTGRKLTDVQKAGIQTLYESGMRRRLNNSKEFNDISERHFNNKDQSGFLKHVAAFDRQAIPQALKAAFDTILPSKPGPKPTNGAGTTPKPGPPTTGFAWVSGPPKKETIDFSRTRGDDIRVGRATLVDGRKVQWKTA